MGYTFYEIGSNPENWRSRAICFKEAAELIAKCNESPPIPYYYNAGFSIELLLKAVAIAKGKPFETNHRLIDLCKLNGIKITQDQELTLELLSEHIVWSGRYPVPKKEGQWDNFHDYIIEKHIERERNVTKANRNRYPTLQNFLYLWNLFENEYDLSTNTEA